MRTGDGQGTPAGRGSLRAAILMGLLVAGGLAAAFRANVWKDDLQVADVRVEGNTIVPTQDLLSLAHISAGDRLFDVDLYGARMRIMENRFVRSASVNRDVPNGITISILEREPVAVVAGQRKFYLDEEGGVLPPTLSRHIFDLPVITGSIPPGDLVSGKQIASPELREALTIVTTARVLGDDMYRMLSEIRIAENKDIIAYTAEAGVPVLFGRGEVGQKLVKLEGFWKDVISRHGVQELQYVDLRFADCIVVRWNHRPDDVQSSGI